MFNLYIQMIIFDWINYSGKKNLLKIYLASKLETNLFVLMWKYDELLNN